MQEIEKFEIKAEDSCIETPGTSSGWRTVYVESEKRFSDFSEKEKDLMLKGKETQYSQCRIKTSLMICAPIKDMDVRGMEIEDGYKLKAHIPDPVVLTPCHMGYFIVTAWGPESSDELVVNQKMN